MKTTFIHIPTFIRRDLLKTVVWLLSVCVRGVVIS